MADNYTVQQGDHLSKIANAFGFRDYRTIWDHPNNSGLKQKRKNPNVLYPGDTVFIPDREPKLVPGATDQCHRFKMAGPVLKLRLTLEDLYEEPIANARCVLILGDDSRNVMTDGKGQIEQDIPPDVRDATLMVQDEQTPFQNTQIAIKIGDLDPVDEISGQQARLNNLGYFAGEIGGGDTEALRSAVEEFQCDHTLKVDGICGPKTQAKLKEVHGC